jgi:hypothetical protein
LASAAWRLLVDSGGSGEVFGVMCVCVHGNSLSCWWGNVRPYRPESRGQIVKMRGLKLLYTCDR